MKVLAAISVLAFVAVAWSSHAAAPESRRLHLVCDDLWAPARETDPICTLFSVRDGLGEYEEARRGPLIDGRPTIEVLFTPQRGTDMRRQAAALVRREGDKVRLLWRHDTVSAFTKPWVVRDEATVYHWRYSADGKTIYVTGSHDVGRFDRGWRFIRGKSKPLPAEIFCYSAQADEFIVCAKRA